MKRFLKATAAAVVLTGLGASSTFAAGGCVTKYAVATSGDEKQAKWFALETTVQSVSWGLWPGFVQTNKVEGYAVSDRYRCNKDSGGYTCHVVATFCKR